MENFDIRETFVVYILEFQFIILNELYLLVTTVFVIVLVAEILKKSNLTENLISGKEVGGIKLERGYRKNIATDYHTIKFKIKDWNKISHDEKSWTFLIGFRLFENLISELSRQITGSSELEESFHNDILTLEDFRILTKSDYKNLNLMRNERNKVIHEAGYKLNQKYLKKNLKNLMEILDNVLMNYKQVMKTAIIH